MIHLKIKTGLLLLLIIGSGNFPLSAIIYAQEIKISAESTDN